LLVEDEPLMRVPLSDRLRKSGYLVEAVATGEEGVARLEKSDFDVAIVDLKLPGIDGLEVLRQLKRLGRTADVVVITAFGTIDTAVAAMKLGARDFLTKPFEASALLEVIDRYVQMRRAAVEEGHELSEQKIAESFHGLVGASPAMRKLFRLISAAAQGRATIIVQGETGTGKELVARAIHAISARREGPFVALNCASIPETLFESELFGVERGAFTGADKRRKGRFELAAGGTLFLDEIDEMPLPPQAKLLRALQERVIERLGGVEQVQLDVRIVAATKVDLRERVASQRFREDLFHRLNVLPVVLPPLRDRGDDVTALAEHFLRRHATEAGRSSPRFSPGAHAWLRAQRFTGNVRELSNVVARAVTLCGGELVEPWHLAAELDAPPPSAPGPSLAESKRESELRRIHEALAQTGGQKAKAAELLGISRKTLWEKLRGSGSGST
jgi:DNA-binding NtrC family response regulator